jgi:hypothetical protein
MAAQNGFIINHNLAKWTLFFFLFSFWHPNWLFGLVISILLSLVIPKCTPMSFDFCCLTRIYVNLCTSFIILFVLKKQITKNAN